MVQGFKYDDGSLDFRHRCRKPGVAKHACNPTSGRQIQKDHRGRVGMISWPANVGKPISSRFNESYCVKNKVDEN